MRTVLRVGLLVLVSVHFILGFQYTPAALKDQIQNLPGLNGTKLSFNQFAGYITVDPVNGRNLFYWHVEAESDPANKPLTFWTNGGPGCSGLLGFLTEQGPFAPTEGGKFLMLNDYAWNKLSNMVFIEAPAGVGFSYSKTPSDYRVGDARTAVDNRLLILGFLERFPHFNQTTVYITSESYGGHYMPTLAKVIVDANNNSSEKSIKFGGFAVGNPYTDPISNDYYGTYLTFCGHGLVSRPTCLGLEKHCSGTNPGIECPLYKARASNEVGNLDPYALDYPVCLTGGQQRRRLLEYILSEQEYKNLVYPYDPCRTDYATSYLNRADVQQAIHVLPTNWQACSFKVEYNSSDLNVPMEPIYESLLKNENLNILVYSGDDDSVCGLLGTLYWIYQLAGTKEISSWKSWTDDDGQVGGYSVAWQGAKGKLYLRTVHGAGHEVPTYKPQRALALFRDYLNGSI